MTHSAEKYCPFCKVSVRPIPDYSAVARMLVLGLAAVIATAFVLVMFSALDLVGILVVSFLVLALVILSVRSMYRRARVCPMCGCPSRSLLESSGKQ